MRSFSRFLMVLIGIFCCSQAVAGIRCGNDLISVGDTSFEVRIKLDLCGSIIEKERVGTTTETQSEGEKAVAEERNIERWYIRVNEKGGAYCYPLTFEGGRLLEIGTWRKCN